MTPKRGDSSSEPSLNGRQDTIPTMSQVLRAVDEASKSTRDETRTKTDEERMSLFWRVFGGTILSIVTLISITLFNNIMSSLSELRADLAKANEARINAITELRTELNRAAEARADLIRKDEFNTRMNSQWDRVQALQQQNTSQNATLTSLKTELDGLKERISKQIADFDTQRKELLASGDGIKKEITGALEVQKKEQAVTNESLKKELAAMELIKERLAAAVVDMKSQREELLKLKQDLASNQTYDLERKESRDSQFRQLEQNFKEIQKAIQECREKLVRLETLSGPTTPPPSPKKNAVPPSTPANDIPLESETSAR